MPLHVVEFTFQSGFESLSLRQIFNYLPDAQPVSQSIKRKSGNFRVGLGHLVCHDIALDYGVTTSYGYDSLSRLLSVLHQTGSTTLDGASYTYDPAGNRTSKANYLNGITENYTYDALYQLTQVTQGNTTTESYNYDLVGNRLSSLSVPLYNYNSSNELTSSSGRSYTYDNGGNT